MRFEFKPEDFLKGQVVKQPGWTPCVCIDYEETTASTGVAGFILTWKAVAGPNKDCISYDRFWENAPGFVVAALDAINGKPIDRKAGSIDFSRDKFVGKTADLDLRKGEWNNKPKNDIAGYKPYTGPAQTSAPAQAGV